MDKKTATALIRDTLQSPFEKERYSTFVKNLLNNIDESKAFTLSGQYIPEKFRDFVKSYERIGTFIDPEGMKLDVLIVNLKNESTLARARTAQRNFVANYLKERDEKDAGLVAFVSPNPDDWRFSFVKMDYQLVEVKGKMKAKEDLTPARRYSFLVGSQESSHTAQQQLLPILTDDKHNPTLKMIEKAFSIETVTKEFFEKYRELFLEVKEALDDFVQKDKAIRTDFETKGVNTADFAKKLLGQIVFLYFLQKKGWFGVERDAEWGSGPKNFLRQLFAGELTQYKNFFNDVLEPLFYEALATPRDENFYSKFNCKIPFLNGGLFDPINGYDWIHTDITLPNELFSNAQKTKEGDMGTGILDMFDRYNFTVKEDEPLEKEVAVDPEMLGKVFENLLEVKDRKSKGTYYTPREIVHYMCQESLINYLSTELGDSVPREDISLFIQIGETVAEHESRVVSKGKETSSYTHKLPESIRKFAAEIDKKLQTIRVCDPAIGSGAFPVGMMNEIVRARQTLTSYLGGNGDRTSYDFKRHAIQESLYGVDIDPGAVEIAKLRLWLSLVVDEDDIGNIKPLPNLDYRIMQGNSLLEEYEGIKLFDEKLLGKDAEGMASELEYARQRMKELQKEYFALNSDGKLTDVRKQKIETEVKKLQKREKELSRQPETEKTTGMFDTPSQAKAMYEQIKKLHQDFFEATHREKKKQLKEQIENLEWALIETSLSEQKKSDSVIELKKLKTSNMRPFFLWRLYFAEVFTEKGGFDVIIGNPPWEKVKPQDPEFFSKYEHDYRKFSKDEQVKFKTKMLQVPQIKREYDFFVESRKKIMEYAAQAYELQGSGDLNLYKLFVEASLTLSSNIVCWVIPGSITIDEGSCPIRKYLLENKILCELLGFSNKEKSFEWVDNNQKFVVVILSKRSFFEKIKTLGWLTNAKNLDRIKHIEMSSDFYNNFDDSNLTLFLTDNHKTIQCLSDLLKNPNLKKLKDLPLHYWREFDATMDAKYFNDKKGNRLVFSGKAIDQFDCMSKSWLEKHGRSSKWRKMGFPKDEESFRTEYFSDAFPDRIKKHHDTENSDFRIVIQNVTGTVNNLRTVYAAPLHKKHLTNNSLHNLYIGNSDKELFFYLGILNSFALDWQARIKVATNLNKFILESFIFPDYDKSESVLRDKLSNISFHLSNVCDDFKGLESYFEPQSFSSREDALVVLNAIAAQLYDLDYNKLNFILSHFDLVDGRYRSRILDEIKNTQR